MMSGTFFLGKERGRDACAQQRAEDELGQLVGELAQETKNSVDFSENGDVN